MSDDGRAGDDMGLDRLGLDGALREDLRSAGELDQVSTEAMAAAKAGFLWRTIDAELAELVADSAEDDKVLAGVRSTATVRMLMFRSPALTVEVEVLEVGDRCRLIGQLVPAQAGRIAVRHGGGTQTVAADEHGRFSVDDLLPGPVSLHCSALAETAAITTDWVVL